MAVSLDEVNEVLREVYARRITEAVMPDPDATARPGTYMGIERSTYPIFSSRVPTSTRGLNWKDLFYPWDPDLWIDVGL